MISTQDPEKTCKHRDGCRYEKIPNTDYCPRHGGNKALERHRKQSIYNLNKTAYKQTIERFIKDPERYTLGDELGVTRMLLQQYLDKCQDFESLQMYQNTIQGLIDKITKLVEACFKLDEKLASLITKQELVRICQILVDITAEVINDEDKITEIVTRFDAEFSERNNN